MCTFAAGLNVARLAGLPDGVIKRAAAFAARLEAEHERRLHTVRGKGHTGASSKTELSRSEVAAVRQLRATFPSGKGTGACGANNAVDALQLWRSLQAGA